MDQQKTIREQINSLIELQVVDREIYALTGEKDRIPSRIKEMEKSLESKKSGIKQAEDGLKALQVKLKDKEIGLQQKEEQIKKLQTQLYQLKSNREYSAMLTEIGGIKADNSLAEEEIIKLMEEIDIVKKRMNEEKDLFKKEEVSSQKEKDDIKKREGEIDSRLSELALRRGKIIPAIDKVVLARYERVLKNRDGLAIVPVVDGACGGCHMSLPPQVISEAKLKEDVVICGSCSRILYVEDNAEIN